MGNEQCKRLHISSFSTFTFFSQTPYSSDFPVRPLSFVPPHLTSNFPDYHTNRISTFDSAFFPPNITCYDSTDNYCKNPQQLCSNTATVLQCRCNQLCSSAATALQWRCISFAVTLQRLCSSTAKSMQQLCSDITLSIKQLRETLFSNTKRLPTAWYL